MSHRQGLNNSTQLPRVALVQLRQILFQKPTRIQIFNLGHPVSKSLDNLLILSFKRAQKFRGRIFRHLLLPVSAKNYAWILTLQKKLGTYLLLKDNFRAWLEKPNESFTRRGKGQVFIVELGRTTTKPHCSMMAVPEALGFAQTLLRVKELHSLTPRWTKIKFREAIRASFFRKRYRFRLNMPNVSSRLRKFTLVPVLA